MRFSGRRSRRFLALAIAFSLAVCAFLPADFASARVSRSQGTFGMADVGRSLEQELVAISRGGLLRIKGASQGEWCQDCAPGMPPAFFAAVPTGPVTAINANLSFRKLMTPVSRRVRLDE